MGPLRLGKKRFARKRFGKTLIATAIMLAVVLLGAPAAYACGGLIGPNGSVRLLRTSTLAAWDDGVEHYVTNFEFAGSTESFGSIIPLPAEPTRVERGGDWTLQRLEREIGRDEEQLFERSVATEDAAASAEVLQQVRIDSLDVTILKGGGAEVATWAAENGFQLSDDAPEVLSFYGDRSPYFMAAKFDAEAALAEGFSASDGVPVHLTIPVENPWVPVHILGLGKPGSEVVEADIFLLTPEEPSLFSGTGIDLEISEQASSGLLDDLRSDAGMEWIPDNMWFSHLAIDGQAKDLTWDLVADVKGTSTPSASDAGTGAPELTRPADIRELALANQNGWSAGWMIVIALLGTILGIAIAALLLLARQPRPPATHTGGIATGGSPRPPAQVI